MLRVGGGEACNTPRDKEMQHYKAGPPNYRIKFPPILDVIEEKGFIT